MILSGAVIAAGREERRSRAQDDRVHDEPILVDETARDELRRERRSTHVDLAVELALELRKLVANVRRERAVRRARRIRARGTSELRLVSIHGADHFRTEWLEGLDPAWV